METKDKALEQRQEKIIFVEANVKNISAMFKLYLHYSVRNIMLLFFGVFFFSFFVFSFFVCFFFVFFFINIFLQINLSVANWQS